MYLAMYGYGRMENTDLLGSVIGLLPMALGLAAGALVVAALHLWGRLRVTAH